jgi:TPR repeat protein
MSTAHDRFKCECGHPFGEDHPLYPKNGVPIPLGPWRMKCAKCGKTIVATHWSNTSGMCVLGIIAGYMFGTIADMVCGINGYLLGIVGVIAGAIWGVVFESHARSELLRDLSFIAAKQRQGSTPAASPIEPAPSDLEPSGASDTSSPFLIQAEEVEGICDICACKPPVGMVTAQQMRRAVAGGFNPVKLGIVPMAGLERREVQDAFFAHWRQMVNVNGTDWGLCADCAAWFRPYDANLAPARPRDQRQSQWNPSAGERGIIKKEAKPRDANDSESAPSAANQTRQSQWNPSPGKREEMQKAAEQGDTDAMYDLWLMHSTGSGVPQNNEEGLRWLEKSHSGGNARATYVLGTYYAEGSKDDSRALALFEKAANMGVGDAMCELGTMYASGRGMRKNYGEACRWWEKAAAAECAKGARHLGEFYLRVSRHLEKAKHWYEKAAELGDAEAMYALGLMHGGEESLRDSKVSFKWFEKAAHKGHPAAMTYVGRLYLHGAGTRPDMAEARRWAQKAKAVGDPNTGELLQQIRDS